MRKQEKEGMMKKIGNNINKVIVIPNGVDLPIKSQKIVEILSNF